MDTVSWSGKADCGVEVEFRSHQQPDLDELAASWLILRTASTGWIEQHLTYGRIDLGIDGGKFDEHGDGRREECCLTLVAKELSVYGDIRFQQLIRHVYTVDVDGKGQPFYLYNIVKLMHRHHPGDPNHVIAWTFDALDAKHRDQIEYVEAIDLVRTGDIHSVTNGRRTIKVLVVRADNTALMKAAQSQKALEPDVLVQIKSTGNTQIYRRPRSGLKMHRVVRRLRVAEADKRGREIDRQQRRNLDGEGMTAGDTTWYFAVRGQMILNGSLTNPHVEPTHLFETEILACIEKGILEVIGN